MKKLFAILLCVLMIISFTSCKSEDNTEEVNTNAPETTIDPRTVDWGYNEEKDEYDRWYLQGTDDVIYIYFTQDNVGSFENCICTYNLVKSGVVKESISLCYNSDNSLTPALSSNTYIELVFEDYFNVYDYATDSVYSRGNSEEYNSYFNDKTFTTEDGNYSLSFTSDKTFSELSNDATADSKDVSGKWEIVSPKTLVLTKDEKDISCKTSYNDDFSVKSVEYNGLVYYAVYSEDETVNKYKAY